MNSFIQDLRVAIRGLRRAPTFAVTAVLILGLGIGMATAMFTVFRAVLLERLPVTAPDRLVVLRTLNRGATKVDPAGTVITDIQRDGRTTAGIAGVYHHGTTALPILDGERQLTINRTAVTGNFFDVLGTRPLLGRLLRPDDGARGAAHVIVLSYGVWQHDFGGDPAVVGHKLLEPYEHTEYTIVGVAPAGLDYPLHVGTWEAETPQLDSLQQLVVARLAPGATPAAAASEFLGFVKRLETQGFGVGTFVGAVALPFEREIVGDMRPVLWALSAAVSLLLIIACVNVGNLLLLRASMRSRELAVRRAVGASYLRIVRQLATESVLLAALGGTLGVCVAATLLRVLVAAAPTDLPRLDLITLDIRTLLIALGVTASAVLLFGIAPALAAARGDLASPLRADSRSGRESIGRHAARRWLVASQVALALVLVMGAGLLARSVRRLQEIPLGWSADHLTFFSLTYPVARYDSNAKMEALGQSLYLRLREVPGVRAITPVVDPPFMGPDFWIMKLAREEQTPDEASRNPFIPWEVGGTDYFRTFGIPILRGRGFAKTDDATSENVAVISESLARQLFAGRDPIGQQLHPANGQNKEGVRFRVVGVAADTHYRELRRSTPVIYLPFRQIVWQGTFAVRTTRDFAQVLPRLQRAISDIDPQIAIWQPRSATELLDAPLAQPRLSALLLSGFGFTALLLAAIGLYGVMASSVRERTRELGVRLALGASPEDLRATVLRQAMGITLIGIACGVAASVASMRVLRGLLFEVSPGDPVVMGAVCVVFLVVAGVAAYVPARRATRIDPAIALRAD